jgi:hypothetical protein
MDWIVHSILAEVLLCIRVATRLAIGCRPKDTYCQCCFVLTDKMCFAGEVAMAGATVVVVLALRAHAPVD